MTTRRINWTERLRITRDHAQISLVPAEVPSFEAKLVLSHLQLPLDARVIVEAYESTNLVRFDYGTVGLLRAPADTSLREFESPEGVLFRVKVVGVGGLEGRILAEADKLRPQDVDADQAGRDPLLKPQGKDLGELVWKLEIDDGVDGPRFYINKQLGNWRELARTPAFIWMVYPEVLRQILRVAASDDRPQDDETCWQSRWLRFAGTITGTPSPPDDELDADEREQWVEDVVQAFARQHQMRERYLAILTEGIDA